MAAMRWSRALPGVALVLVAIAGCNLTRSPEAAIESTAPPSPGAVRDLVGPGCDAYVQKHPSGRGSVGALARQSAATAIASHPDLTRFAEAISGRLNPKVDLTAELNDGEYTIFAPADSAFAKLPAAALRTLAEPQSAGALTDLLRSHVVKDERMPGALNGRFATLAGGTLAVAGTGDRIRVGGQANVVCGGFRAANATLYVIDGVLMPPAQAASTSTGTASPTPDNQE